MNMGIVILVVLIVVVVYFISVRNKLKTLEIKIDEASSGIDVALTKRYDVLTKMIDVVKGYVKYEESTLLEVIKMRSGMTLGEMSDASRKMDSNMEKINALAESYPELKASENYKQLQLAISDTEEHLQAARRLYNSNVSIYNQNIVSFPTSVIASMVGSKKREFFSADEEKKEDVKIDL